MAKLKFMGSSHIHRLDKGDNFGGQLSEGLSKEVTFDRSNNWIVDTDEVELSSDAVQILVKSGDFKDVSDLKTIPANEHQKIFLGMKSGEKVEGEGDDEDEPRGQNLPDDDEPAQGSTETDDTPGTTVGGSTARGGTTARGRRTT